MIVMAVDDDDEIKICFRAKEVWGSLENVKKEKNKLSKLDCSKHRRCEQCYLLIIGTSCPVGQMGNCLLKNLLKKKKKRQIRKNT